MTEEEKKEAAALKRIWNQRKKELREKGIRLTQESAAGDLGFDTQGAVSQYLNGKIKLNIDAIIKFSQLLDCKPSDIRPSLNILLGEASKRPSVSHKDFINHELENHLSERVLNDEVRNFARNLLILMRHHNDTPSTLSNRSGVDEETISSMINPSDIDIPDLVNIGLIARAYGLQTWHMLYPHAPVDILINSAIEKFVDNYAHANAETREAWGRIAEESVKYHKVKNE